ncbi:MAG: alpha/beta hydrolase [Aeromicrobium sp.]|uniref:alpha/beta fold hydrolase n=1 Tax=Aeromicrobium sp. TaxID=1871063 RepID=UPI003C69CBF5
MFLWDMPGFGASIGEAPQAVDLVRQGRRLGTVLDDWQLDRTHVMAHDIGGAVALRTHLLEGRDFSLLYLLDIVTLEPWGSPFLRLVSAHETVFAALPHSSAPTAPHGSLLASTRPTRCSSSHHGRHRPVRRVGTYSST